MTTQMVFTFDDDQPGQRLSDPTTLGDGRHLLADDLDGARVHVVVRNGVVVSVDAERDGQPVEAYYIVRTVPEDGSGSGEQRAQGVRCYLCACSGDSCTCRPVACPGGG